MDTSFTFVTSLTPATGKTKGVPRFSKLSSEKGKSSKSKPTKNPSNPGEPNFRKHLDQKKLNIDSFSTSSSLMTNDSSISLKSCSESIHFSSDRSFGDHDKKATTSKPVSSKPPSNDQTAFQKIVQEIHAQLEKITFRKIKTTKANDGNEARKKDCVEHISSIKIDENVDVKLSTPINGCDKKNSANVKSHSTEELNKLEDDMHNLSLEKITNTRTKKSRSKFVNKKLFSNISNDDNSSSVDIIDSTSTASQDGKKKPILASDASTINLDDISPILRISVAPSNNFYTDNENSLSPKNILKEQSSELNCDKIEIPAKIESKVVPKKEKKSVIKPTKDKDNKKNIKVLSELNTLEENKRDEDKPKIKSKLKENSSRTQTKKTRKKKDSFIVSDASSDEDDCVSVYHKFISENIKFDVIKTTTPRSKYKKNSIFHDDGIFTPFIIPGKRSSSESENEDNSNEIRNSKKTRLSSSDEEDICISNVRKTIFLSSTSLSSNEENKPPPSSYLELPKIGVEKKEKKIQPKKNIKSKKFIGIKSSSESLTESPKRDARVDLTSSPSFTPRSNTKTNKKITPITFKLKNLNKFTPARNLNSEKEPLSFLRSLSTLASPNSIHPDAEQYRKSFKKLKDELAKKLFVLFNKEVFDNQLPEDLEIKWNPRLRKTSGLCYNRRIKHIIGPNKECLRASRIALSTKIIESPERLRDTLIHELCHAAAWLIDNKADGHGPCWKSWTLKAMRRFPELPPIKRCHNYSIQTKFKYRCVNCGYTIGRHSKSLNLDRKRCGHCYGQFELLVNNASKKANVSGSSPKNVQIKPLSKFALFVKENYGKIKSENSEMKHGDVMKILGKNFASTKN